MSQNECANIQSEMKKFICHESPGESKPKLQDGTTHTPKRLK